MEKVERIVEAIRTKPSPFDPDVKLVLLGSASPFIQNATKASLEDERILAMTASSDTELLEIAPMFPFAAIIIDVDMTGMNGPAALTQIRAAGGTCAHVPVIFVSWQNSHPAADMCRRLGMKLLVIDDEGFNPLNEFLADIEPPAFGEALPCR